MKKDYDTYVTAQNTPRFREKRIIFLESMFFMLINLLVFAIFYEERKTSFVLFLVFLLFTAAQYFDNRKDIWTWFSIAIYVFVAIIVTVFLIITNAAQQFWTVLLFEILICCATLCFLLKKRPAK